jgi:predicted nuclease of predicted toxin-antitoxin system
MPNAVAKALRRRDIDVLTSTESGLRGSPDATYLDWTLANGRVLVTRDADFLRLHQQQKPHAGIVYCEPPSRSIGEVVALLVLIYEVLEPADLVNRVEFL